jgi:hypothetical protein
MVVVVVRVMTEIRGWFGLVCEGKRKRTGAKESEQGGVT